MRKDENLARAVRTSVNSGKKIRAVVVEYLFDRVTVRLVGNGQVMRNLPIVGGPVDPDDVVFVDTSTKPPTVYAKGNEYLSQSDLDKALEKVGSITTSAEAKISIVLFSGGGVLAMYSPSVDGLGAALAAAQPGDLVWVNDIEIEADITVPDGVALVGVSSRQSVIMGTVTLGNDSSLENLAIIKAVYSGDEVNALIAQDAGEYSWVRHCEIHAYNCGSGIARAVKVGAGTDRIQLSNCVIVADANESSTASAFDGAGGICYVTDCQIYSKSADHFNGTTFYVHSNITHVSEIDRRCVPVVAEDHQQHKSHPIPEKHGSMPRQAWSTVDAHQFIDEVLLSYNEGSHCKFGDYVYQDFTAGSSGNRVIREVRTTDGNTIDVTVWTGSPFSIIGDRMIAVTGRELNVLYTSSSKARVYKVNFETETSQIVLEFDIIDNEGDPETSIGYKRYDDLHIYPIKADNGDLFLVIAGVWRELYRNDITYGDVYTGGPVFWVKNWTQGGGWQKHEGPAFEDDTVALDQNSNGIIATVVDARYLVCTTNFQFDNVAGNIASIGCWSFDIQTEDIDMDIKTQVPSYGTGAPSPGRIAHSQIDECAYILYNGSDYEYSGSGFDVVYKYNPINGTMTEYVRATGSQDYFLLVSNNDQVYMWLTDSGDIDFMELSGKTLVLETATLPTWNAYSTHLNDSAEIIGYNKTTGMIILWNILTDAKTTVDVDLEADTASQGVYIWQMNGCYIIFGEKWISGSNYETMAWVIVDGS